MLDSSFCFGLADFKLEKELNFGIKIKIKLKKIKISQILNGSTNHNQHIKIIK